MSIKLGTYNIKDLYLGTTKISEAYLGSTKVYSSAVVPYIVLQFSNLNFNPSKNNSLRNRGTWTRLSSVLNTWKFTRGNETEDWNCLFSSDASTPVGVLTTAICGGTVDVVDFGNLQTITDTNRMFANCDAIRRVVDFFDTTATGAFSPQNLYNTSAMFNGCTGLDESDEITLYQSVSGWSPVPSNHSAMFANSNSSAMDYIPIAWGGNLASAGVYLANTLNSNKWCWHIDNLSGLDMSTLSSVEIYTSASLSQYAGINRRKSNIKWASGTTANRNNPIYYYPFIGTISNSAGSTPPTAIQHAFITTNYNGVLTGSTTAGDMPGTLDPATTGPLAYEIGTYDSTQSGTYCFGFLVTQTAPSGMSALTSLNYADCNYGLLNNSYLSSHAPLFYNPDTLVNKEI